MQDTFRSKDKVTYIQEILVLLLFDEIRQNRRELGRGAIEVAFHDKNLTSHQHNILYPTNKYQGMRQT